MKSTIIEPRSNETSDHVIIQQLRDLTGFADRRDHLLHAVRRGSVRGMYLEFGVREGRSLNLLAQAIEPEVIYGFDSFEGLPEDWHKRRDGTDTVPRGTYAVSKPPAVAFNAELVTGLFADTLPAFLEIHPKPVSFINIDSDLYSSASTVLSTLDHRIMTGALLVFDELCDWTEGERLYDLWREGEYRALIEWLSECDREVMPLARDARYGATLIVSK